MPRSRAPAPTRPAPPPDQQAAPAVEVMDLVKRYGRRDAVDGLALSAARGAITVVVGPNGAGKTTAIECCEGLRRPDSGRVRVLGLDPIADARSLRPRVGVMLQDGGLPPAAPVGSLLDHWARLHAAPAGRAAALLDRLGLAGRRKTTVRRLSGGQRQRLALAAALVGEPEVAFLDEPSASLDPHARLIVWQLIRELRDGGTGVILTTHSLEEAEQLADHVVIMDGGRSVLAGPPGELTGGGEALVFQAAEGLDLSGLMARLPDGIAVQEIAAGQYRVAADPALGAPAAPGAAAAGTAANGTQPGADRPTVDSAVVAVVSAWCAENGVHPAGLALRARTLEDVFFALTGRQR